MSARLDEYYIIKLQCGQTLVKSSTSACYDVTQGWPDFVNHNQQKNKESWLMIQAHIYILASLLHISELHSGRQNNISMYFLWSMVFWLYAVAKSHV